MIRNRHLPQWLHRVASGALVMAVLGSVASEGLRRFEPGGWLHFVSRLLLWGSVPIGLVSAWVAHRFSIVEGCAGEAGYEDLENDGQRRPPG
jgi:hypothetical protein